MTEENRDDNYKVKFCGKERNNMRKHRKELKKLFDDPSHYKMSLEGIEKEILKINSKYLFPK